MQDETLAKDAVQVRDYWQGQGHFIEDPAMVEQFLVDLTDFYDRELR